MVDRMRRLVQGILLRCRQVIDDEIEQMDAFYEQRA